MNYRPIIQAEPHPISTISFDRVDDDTRYTTCIATLESWFLTTIDFPGFPIHGARVATMIGGAAERMRSEVREIPEFVSMDRIRSSHRGWFFHFPLTTQTIAIGGILECRYDDRDFVNIFGFVQVGSIPNNTHPFLVSLVRCSMDPGTSLLGPFHLAGHPLSQISVTLLGTETVPSPSSGFESAQGKLDLTDTALADVDRNIKQLVAEIDTVCEPGNGADL